MRKDKELGALSVMEALSAVDEELLERCEKPGADAAGGNKKASIHRFVQRYAKGCAACLCLAVLGAAYFGMSQMHMFGNKSNEQHTEMNSGGAAKDFEQMEGAAGNAAPLGKTENAAEAADGMFSYGGESFAGGEPEWLDVDSLAASKPAEPESAEIESEREQSQMQSAWEPSDSDGAPEQNIRAEEDLMSKADVPEEYSLVETKSGDMKRQDSLLYEWSDGEHSLWLRITQTELTVDMRIDAEPPIYTLQEEWKELIPDAGADGYVQFALLYENGMLAEYCGVLERDEIIRLMESLVW